MMGGRRWGYLLLLAPLPLFVALIYILPFLGVVRWSVTLPEPGLSQYARVFSDPIVLGVTCFPMFGSSARGGSASSSSSAC
jgi:hypothetical protein